MYIPICRLISAQMEKTKFKAVIKHFHLKGLTPAEIKAELDSAFSFGLKDEKLVAHIGAKTESLECFSQPFAMFSPLFEGLFVPFYNRR